MLRHTRGFSIVELLVAVALGGILLGGAVSLFVNNRDTARITNEFAQMQDSARFAMELMLRDLRMAGYYGCQNDIESVSSLVTIGAGQTGALWDATFAIEGFDSDANNDIWYPSGYATNLGGAAVVGTDGDNGQVRAGTDGFVVRYLRGSYADVGADGTPDAEVTASTTTSVTANDLDAARYEVGSIAGISDCGGTELFVVDNDPAGGDVLNVYTAGGTQLAREYPPANRPAVAPFTAFRYYVGSNSRGNPALYRVVLGVDGKDSYSELPQELFEGVENLQILYGVDRDDDGAPDAYLPAGDTGAATEEDDLDLPAEWRQVVAVKIALMVTSNTEHQGADLSARNYELLDVTLTPGDQRRRRVFTSTTVLRNLQ